MKWINEYLRSELGKIDSDALEQKDNFNLWHVEPLLNQAADLLDRCLSDHTTERSFEERSALISLDYEERKKRSQLEKKRVETDKVHERDDIIIREQKRILDAFLDEEATIADLEYLAKKLDDLNEAGGQNYRNKIQRKDIYLQKQVAILEKFVREKRGIWSTIDLVDTKTDYDDRQAVFLDRQKYIESPDGPLNLLNQRDKIRERVADDFKRAAIRMTRAAQGLEQIFGYSDPLPALVANSDLLDTDALPLNRAVKWVRDAISWLIGFSQHDQAFTRCVSLRAANPSLWSQNAVDLHGDGATFRIEISRELFSSHKFVRLRGLSAFVVGDNVGYTPWRAIVTLPREAQYLRYDGPSFITQTLPSCDLGRVERWDIGREPEVCGSLSLLNGSPIGTPGDGGKWEITIKAPQQIDSSALKLEDFQLHIMVVGQPS